MIEQPAGLISIGARSGQFCFDNELPVHSYYLQPHALASRLITNAQYREFIDDGGYQQPQLWLSDGWSWLQLNPDVRAPLYWVERDGQWFEYHLNGLMSLQEQAPVCHVSFYEADAFARWRGMRLPLEQEWEAAASTEPEGHFIDLNHLRPLPAPQGSGLQQMYGDVWQWTQSAYLPYPGFAPAGGAIGEYNGKFMSGQRVLRGGSCVTSRDHIRSSYRNFFYPQDRWQFSGIRLACDLPS
jgi:ergothioneine biosynthesis protein EgtB